MEGSVGRPRPGCRRPGRRNEKAQWEDPGLGVGGLAGAMRRLSGNRQCIYLESAPLLRYLFNGNFPELYSIPTAL